MADKLESTRSSSDNGIMVKEEPMDIDALDREDEPPAFGPAALGLHRVGTKLPPKPTPSVPLQKLNARGMPARIRKKNRFIFVDDFVNTSPPRNSPRKTPKILLKTPTKHSSTKKQKTPVKVLSNSEDRTSYIRDRAASVGNASPDRKSGQKIGMRLRNLLKLPKAHKWVCFEYFYSNIDKALFDGENDFMICLKESFPQLMNKKMSRVQWAKIRRMMGKPRRCSQSFFDEERKELYRKRKLIRYVQQRKSADVNLKDLPNEIPMQLVIGTKVTARLRNPQDGLFTGCINAVDTSNNTYRITFERPKLGTHSVPDYEVLSNEPPDTISLTAITHKFRPRYVMQEIMNLYNQEEGFSNCAANNIIDIEKCEREGTIGAYPFQLFYWIVKLSKILDAKRTSIVRLREYNTEAEKCKCFGENLPEGFERKYADIVIDLEKMNLHLKECINEIQIYCVKIAPGAMIMPGHVKDKYQEEASLLVLKNNTGHVQDENILELITDLTSLMLQIKGISESEETTYELGVLQGTMDQIKSKLEPQHKIIFQNYVETHTQRIHMGIGMPSSSFYESEVQSQ